MIRVRAAFGLEAGLGVRTPIQFQIKNMLMVSAISICLLNAQNPIRLHADALAVALGDTIREKKANRRGQVENSITFQIRRSVDRSHQRGLDGHDVQLVLERQGRDVRTFLHGLPADGRIIEQAAFR